MKLCTSTAYYSLIEIASTVHALLMKTRPFLTRTAAWERRLLSFKVRCLSMQNTGSDPLREYERVIFRVTASRQERLSTRAQGLSCLQCAIDVAWSRCCLKRDPQSLATPWDSAPLPRPTPQTGRSRPSSNDDNRHPRSPLFCSLRTCAETPQMNAAGGEKTADAAAFEIYRADSGSFMPQRTFRSCPTKILYSAFKTNSYFTFRKYRKNITLLMFHRKWHWENLGNRICLST